MGKLAIISDLHADINHLSDSHFQQIADYLKQQQVDHLHLAGDIANKKERALAVIGFFQGQGLSVTFHWGNHEMADLTEQDIEGFDHPAFLNFQSIALSDTHLLLGVNGWYDYQYSDLTSEKEIMRLKRLFWYDRMIHRQGTDPEISHAINQHLRKVLATIPADKHVILSTHFVPQPAFIVRQTGKYARWNHLNAFLGSPEFGAVVAEFPQVQQVVFGHTHRRFEPKHIAGALYHCRPLGYYYEWAMTRRFVQENQLTDSYQPTKIRGMLRQYDAAFAAYKQVHLIEELEQGITFITY
ncbi:metallophosphoesterase [Enterococcus sp. DIV0876]|uniref:metallophosphoesterase n=1 Tax=Enterococcus sp. DIV0876 TaxID=2774633 RepID=UPI003D2FE7B9